MKSKVFKKHCVHIKIFEDNTYEIIKGKECPGTCPYNIQMIDFWTANKLYEKINLTSWQEGFKTLPKNKLLDAVENFYKWEIIQ